MYRTLTPAMLLILGLPIAPGLEAAPEHPKEALCTVCAEHGEAHGPEKVAAMSTYEGTTYSFCSKDCRKAFEADPAGYMPQVFPRPADPLTATDLEDRPVSLADYEGKVVLVDFWATWCKPCLEIMPRLHELESAYSDRGFSVLGVSIDEKPEKVHEFVKKQDIPYRVALDDPETPTWAAYRVKASHLVPDRPEGSHRGPVGREAGSRRPGGCGSNLPRPPGRLRLAAFPAREPVESIPLTG